MTSSTKEPRVIDEAVARAAMLELEKIERALDTAYQTIADSLGVKDRDAVDRRIKWLKEDVKTYMQDSGETSLHEGELGTNARVHVSYNAASYDLVTAAATTTGPVDLAEAAKAGMLKLDNGMLEKFRGSAGASWADRLFRYRIPGGIRAVSLYIERK